jgi:hypothetical protein
VRLTNEERVEDLSVSLTIRAYTIHAVGKVFGCFLVRLLGIGRERLHFHVSSSSVHHTGFTLSAEEHEQYAERPVNPLSPEELAAFRRDWALYWRTRSWERIP